MIMENNNEFIDNIMAKANFDLLHDTLMDAEIEHLLVIAINEEVDIKCAMKFNTLIDCIVNMANANNVLRKELIKRLKN